MLFIKKLLFYRFNELERSGWTRLIKTLYLISLVLVPIQAAGWLYLGNSSKELTKIELTCGRTTTGGASVPFTSVIRPKENVSKLSVNEPISQPTLAEICGICTNKVEKKTNGYGSSYAVGFCSPDELKDFDSSYELKSVFTPSNGTLLLLTLGCLFAGLLTSVGSYRLLVYLVLGRSNK